MSAGGRRADAVKDGFGLDVDYTGGLCAEVIAPAGIRYDSGNILGYYLDIDQPTWMHVWAKP